MTKIQKKLRFTHLFIEYLTRCHYILNPHSQGALDYGGLVYVGLWPVEGITLRVLRP